MDALFDIRSRVYDIYDFLTENGDEEEEEEPDA